MAIAVSVMRASSYDYAKVCTEMTHCVDVFWGPRDNLTQVSMTRAELYGIPYGKEVQRRLTIEGFPSGLGAGSEKGDSPTVSSTSNQQRSCTTSAASTATQEHGCYLAAPAAVPIEISLRIAQEKYLRMCPVSDPVRIGILGLAAC